MRTAVIGFFLGISLAAGHGAVSTEFSVTSCAVSVPEVGFFTNYVLRTDRHDLSFLPPQLWRMWIDTNANILTFQPGDLRTVLRLRLLPGRGTAGSAGDTKSLEPEVRARFPDAEIKGSFPAYCASHSGVAFELEKRGPIGWTITRLMFFSYADRILELELTCAREDFPRIQHQFNSMLNSLRIIPRNDR